MKFRNDGVVCICFDRIVNSRDKAQLKPPLLHEIYTDKTAEFLHNTEHFFFKKNPPLSVMSILYRH